MEAQVEGALALALAVLHPKQISCDDAFELLSGRRIRQINFRRPEDPLTLEILALREKGLTWKQIGKRVGMKDNAVFYRAKRYKARILS